MIFLKTIFYYYCYYIMHLVVIYFCISIVLNQNRLATHFWVVTHQWLNCHFTLLCKLFVKHVLIGLISFFLTYTFCESLFLYHNIYVTNPSRTPSKSDQTSVSSRVSVCFDLT